MEHEKEDDHRREGGGGGGGGGRAMMEASTTASNETWVNVVAGFAAGVTGTLLGHPLDTLKTYMQMGVRGDDATTTSGRGGGRSTLVSVLSRMAKEGGLMRRLYSGVTPPLMSSVLLNAVCFAVYNHNEAEMRRRWAGAGPLIPFVAGSTVGFVSSFISTPFEVVKRQEQVLSSGKHGTHAATSGARGGNSLRFALQLYRSQGVLGFFRGYVVNTIREMVFLSVYFGLYDTARRQLSTSSARADTGADATDVRATTSHSAIAAAGALSGALAWAASFPLDSVCTRVMCNTSSNQPHAFALIRNMLLTTNIATLYSGVGVSMGRAAIVSSTRFTTYEYIRGMT